MSTEAYTMIAVLVTSLISPTILGVITNTARRREKADEVKARLAEKQEDWERQDKVADKAAEAARLLLANNKVIADNSQVANGKLDSIHALVNSQMTTAIQSELDATVRELVLMREVTALHKVAGREPSDESQKAFELTGKKIDELRATLADRVTQQKLADAAAVKPR